MYVNATGKEKRLKTSPVIPNDTEGYSMAEIERSLILVKPDGVQRGLIGECIKRFEQRGLKVVGLKMLQADENIVGEHYAEDTDWLESVGRKTAEKFRERGKELNESHEEVGRRVRGWLMDYLSSGPVVAFVVEGYHAVDVTQKIVGSTEPLEADPGTIRGDFSVESYQLGDKEERPVLNVVHTSGEPEEAEEEIPIWFTEDELHSYDRVDWTAMHDNPTEE